MNPQNSDSKTVWIGDLENYMDEIFITKIINDLTYGNFLLSVKVIKDKQTNTQNKYGFIQFNSHQIASKFIQDFNAKPIPSIPSKYFKLKWASYGGGVKITSTATPGETSIYIGDLDPSVTQAKLYQFFKAKYPSVFGSKIICDNNTKISKGYGFVKFSNSQQAQKAIIEYNGTSFNGRTIKVSHAYMKSKEEKEADDQEPQSEANHMKKTYQKFFSLMNDPLLKAVYNKQLEKTFGGQQTEKTMKQRLQDLKTLQYSETKQSQKCLQTLMKKVCYEQKRQVEEKIFTI